MSRFPFRAANLRRINWLICVAASMLLSAPLASSATDQAGDHSSAQLSEFIASDEFRIFSVALEKSGLRERIRSEDRFTLFALTDKAMRDEGSAFLLESVLLTRHNQHRLFNLMAHHFVEGITLSPDDLKREATLTTASGLCLSVDRSGTGIRVGPEAFVNGVRRVGNGVVYLIDRLLIPPWQEEQSCTGPASERARASRYTALTR